MAAVKRWAWALAPVLLYMLLIVLISSQSLLTVRGPKDSDKVIHFFEYAVLGGLLARGLTVLTGSTRWDLWAWASLLSVTFGLTDEIHQYFVPRRSASLFDLAADHVGGLVGAAVWIAFARRWVRRKEAA